MDKHQAMRGFSLKWLFVGVLLVAVFSLPLSWVVRQRLEAQKEAARVTSAVEAQMNTSPHIRYGLNGSFSLELECKGVPISAETAKVFADNRRLVRFVLLNCPTSRSQRQVLNEGGFFLTVGNDDEPPTGSLQGVRVTFSITQPYLP